MFFACGFNLMFLLDDLQGWEIVQNGGDRWAAEENRKPFPDDDTVTKCFVTSYEYV